MKVLVTDNVSPKCAEVLKSKGLLVQDCSGTPADTLRDALQEAEALIVRSATKVTPDLLAASPRLKAVGRAGTGVDNIDVQAATQNGVAVFNARAGNSISAAEHAFALMLALARNIPAAHLSMRDNRWERKHFMGVELYEKTLGIVGFGQIGREVGSRARAFGMTVLAYDPLIADAVFVEHGAEKCSLRDLFQRSDFVTVHVPLTPETRHFISQDLFQVCKPGLRLVNASRGGVIDEKALYRALREGRVAGAALDVFEQEPPDTLRLFECENFIATPHLGASTVEAQERVACEIAQVIADYLLHGKTRNILNPGALDV